MKKLIEIYENKECVDSFYLEENDIDYLAELIGELPTFEYAQKCENCGKYVPKSDLFLTYDCHGIPFRSVCSDCYEKIMDEKGYDGEYYSELDECIDWDY